MTVLIAVEGISLNSGLQKAAKLRNINSQKRFRIDHDRLAEFLTNEVLLGDENHAHSLSDEKSLRFYIENTHTAQNDPERHLGKIHKYVADKGYGFVADTDGSSHFFHSNEITNKRALCGPKETRYPRPTSQEFGKRLIGNIVSFELIDDNGRTRAVDMRIEFDTRVLDRYYALRREPFLEMLKDNGYDIIRCDSDDKSSGVFSRISIDSLSELEEDDSFVLVGDSVIFAELLNRLEEFGINTTLLTFKGTKSNLLREKLDNTRVLLLDDFLDDLELSYEEDELSHVELEMLK